MSTMVDNVQQIAHTFAGEPPRLPQARFYVEHPITDDGIDTEFLQQRLMLDDEDLATLEGFVSDRLEKANGDRKQSSGENITRAPGVTYTARFGWDRVYKYHSK
jgi:hypothetical protein